MLSQRNIEIEEENGKETERSVNKTIMDYAVQHVEEKNHSKMILLPTNQTRLRKRMTCPFELVGIGGISKTLEFRKIEKKLVVNVGGIKQWKCRNCGRNQLRCGRN